MSDRTRYQAQSIYQEQGEVTSYLGVDPVTGLPVLIYRFTDAASPQLARLDSEHLPRLLAWRDDDAGGIMVVAWSSALVPVSGQPLDNLQLLESARALSDAAAAGVTHGDLGPDRFLLAGDSVVIEGFGVPWTDRQTTPADDVRAWAASVSQIGHKGSPGVQKLLSDIEAGAEVQPAELLTRLNDLLLRNGAADPEPAAGPGPDPAPAPAADHVEGNSLDGNWDDFAAQDEQYPAFTGTASQVPSVEELELSFTDGAEDDSGTEDPAAAVFIPSSTYASERLTAPEQPEDDTVSQVPVEPSDDPQQPAYDSAELEPEPPADAGQSVQRSQPAPQSLPAGGSSSYLKRLDSNEPPPRTGRSVGVTGQSTGTSPNRPGPARQDPEFTPDQPVQRGNRRIIMISVLAVLTVVLATLLFVLRQRDMDQVPAGMSAGVTYVIDVLVEPDNLPPVNLFVLQSPSGSQFAPNTALGTAPRRMALDAEGTWVFEGRFQGRLSAPVTIQIPEERSSTVTIVIPPEEPDAQ